MKLRDYFAVHAPPMPDDWRTFPEEWKRKRGHAEFYQAASFEAEWRYIYADAMLAERKKQKAEK